MATQIQLKTVTFLLKRRDFEGDADKIMKAAGLQYSYFDIVDLDDWGWINLTVYCCGCTPDSQQRVHVACWYQYQPVGYCGGDYRKTPETYLSITMLYNGLDQADAALAFAKIFDGTELEIEGGPIKAPAYDFVEKLHQAIS